MASLSQDSCPKCSTGYLTVPRASEGFHTPGSNDRRYFQRPQPPLVCNAHQNNPVSAPLVCSKVIQGGIDMLVLNSVTVATRSPASHSPASHINGIPFTYEKPMGRMVDTSYALKILHGDHELPITDHFTREVYRKSQVNSMKARLWLQNGQEAVTLVLAVPHFPWFNPKDSYGYWDDAEWVLTNTAIEIKGGSTTIFLRLAQVTDCVGGPRAKRRLSDALVHTPSPIRVRNNKSVSDLFGYIC
ncbi:hypothetical protein B0H11DRAFT_1934313 [Mycena galericulata]|nr:hypothetical protein B0H11DRAFT_1934313 [Mycena galericulata]